LRAFTITLGSFFLSLLSRCTKHESFPLHLFKVLFPTWPVPFEHHEPFSFVTDEKREKFWIKEKKNLSLKKKIEFILKNPSTENIFSRHVHLYYFYRISILMILISS
jgi:hypothetical protein